MIDLQYDIGHLLSASVLVLSFALLFQRRIRGVLSIFALQATVLAAAAAWQAYIQDAPHLYITAAIALLFKAIAIPVTLQRIVRRLGIHRTVETVLGVGLAMLAGVGLVALSILLVLPVTHAAIALTRDDLALALSVVLLGLLMMITRRNAVTQVVGFMSLENGLILAAVGVRGMPLVVEMSVAFSVMVAFIIFGIFFFHIRERFDTLDLQYLETFRGERQ
jgi:hydrogenase-4 component E